MTDQPSVIEVSLKKPGLAARLLRAAQYIVNGRGSVPEAFNQIGKQPEFFSPGQPIRPSGPDALAGRALDFPMGWNTRLTQRQQEGISFFELQALAEHHDVTRLLIETRKDQLEALPWKIRKITKDSDKDDQTTPEDEKRIEDATKFFEKPDGVTPFATWLRKLIEDLLVIDAPSIYVDESEPGNTRFRVIEGATVNIILDDYGRPLGYQQIIKGVPAWDYDLDQLVYQPRNPRPGRVYGMSPVQQIVILVNIALRRQLSQLEYYTEGNIPDALIGTPKEWSPEQIVAYQKAWDAMNSGNTAERRKAKFVPGDGKILPTREIHLKDEFDEWLARIACYAFSVPPTAFVKMQNRGTAGTAKEAANEEGLAPLMRWVKQLVDHCLHHYLLCDDLEFVYEDNEQEDPETQVAILDKELRNGSLTLNEYRQARGRTPYGEEGDEPMIYLATGPVKLQDIFEAPSPEEQAQAAADQADKSHAQALELQGKKNEGPPPKPGDEEGAAAAVPAAGAAAAAKLQKGMKKTLYINRPLLNADEVIAWAADNGFETTLPADDMHVTVCYSKTEVDWALISEAETRITVRGSERSLERFDGGALVLRFKSFRFADRANELKDLGAEYKFPDYKPHITLTYKGDDIDLDAIEPYRGPLIFGAEEIKPVNENWQASLDEAPTRKMRSIRNREAAEHATYSY